MTYDPKDAIRHIVHDYVYLLAAGTDTQRPLAHPFNHYAERTFHVHCRALAKFFSAEKDDRDIYARHFTLTSFVRTLPIWDDWSDHIDKHLMHLTAGRTKPTARIWTGEANKSFLAEFTAAWGEFRKELKGELKPRFDEAIKKHHAEFKEYPLALGA
jgi:hypothetical protein